MFRGQKFFPGFISKTVCCLVGSQALGFSSIIPANWALAPGFPGDLLIAFFTLGQYDEIHRVESIYSAWRNPRELHKLLLRLANMVLDDPEDRHEKAEALARNEFPPCMVMKMLKIIFFRLSNKLGEYGEYRNKASQCIHDKFVLHLVKAVSHSNPEMIKSLFFSRSATTKAIKEAVYGSAIREKNYE